MNKILIIDDESGIRSVLTDILTDEGYDIKSAEDGIKGLELLKEEFFEVVILDVWLPNMGGIDVLKVIKKEHPQVEVIIISGHANIDMAVKAVKLGAFDFLEKPLSLDKILTLVRNALALRKLKDENINLKKKIFVEDEIVGNSEQILKIKNIINQSAESDARILITGENGTGKELIARAVHLNSARNNGPFIELNCAAIPESLIESELFGHEKGAFTNAHKSRKGKFELAHNGTLFLDEIADMTLSSQAKVLRVLQEMRFERLGSENTISVDVRVVAATNKDIRKEIEEGRFREDLYFRLNVIPVEIPSLRERKSDILLLLNYFLEKNTTRLSRNKIVLSKNAIEMLQNYYWPGNIRQLKNFVERITIMTDSEKIDLDTAEKFLGEGPERVENKSLSEFDELKLNEAREKFESMFILKKLEENSFNVSQTAQCLGIYSSNLHAKIKKYKIELR